MQTLVKTTPAYALVKAERDKNRLHHAYLLVFDDKRNLREAVKTFAKLLFNADMPSSKSEERISSLIDMETFSDCLSFPKDDKKFAVSDAEAILDELTVKPVEGEKKVFLVADFADATPQAQNKLLKALEEPPENVYFFLGATSSYPVLTTVLSRTEKLEIQPFSGQQTEECLKRIYKDSPYTDREYSLCAAASAGSVGNAQNMLDGGFYKDLTEKAFALTMSEFTTLPVAIKKLGDTKYKKELLSLLKLVYRDAFLLKAQAEQKDFSFVGEKLLSLPTEGERIRAIAKKFSLSTLLFAQDALTKAEKEVKFNANYTQCIELALSEILWREHNECTGTPSLR